MLSQRAKTILDYWFGDLDHTPEYFRVRNRQWFMGGVHVDDFIRNRFERDLELAVLGEYSSWLETPKGCMALIILLDQFSLNLYREMPRSYRQSKLAIPITRLVITRGWEYALTPAERIFLYMPLEHSEKISDQEDSVALFRKLANGSPPDLKTPMNNSLDYAIRHRKVVVRFGRFPDRNEAFGRVSTPEEVAFLESSDAPF